MLNKLINKIIIVIFFAIFSTFLSFNLRAQIIKKKVGKNNNIKFYGAKTLPDETYFGIYTLLKKRYNIFNSPFALEFNGVSSPEYVGLIDYRKDNRNFINSYRSFVVNLKFSLFRWK